MPANMAHEVNIGCGHVHLTYGAVSGNFKSTCKYLIFCLLTLFASLHGSRTNG